MHKVKKKLLKVSASNIFDDSNEFAFSNYFNSLRTEGKDGALSWKPHMDLYETENDLVIEIDISSVEEKSVEIFLDESTLLIKGERKSMSMGEKRHYYNMEINFGHFERLVAIPIKIDKKVVIKEYKNGFYIIKIKKI